MQYRALCSLNLFPEEQTDFQDSVSPPHSVCPLAAFITGEQYDPVFWPRFKLVTTLKSKLLNTELL